MFFTSESSPLCNRNAVQPWEMLEVLSALTVNSTSGCNVMWFRKSPVFQRNIGLHLHDWSLSQERNQQNLSLPTASASFLLGVLLNPEYEGTIILRNTGLSLNYMAVQHIRQYTSIITKVMMLWLAYFLLFGRDQILTWDLV
jgi:hypothetical protein